jgi:simple sugar transport system permease protein
LAGALAGGAFAAIPGWLRAYMGATELVSTIMLNYVAIDICSYAVSPGGPLAGKSGVGVGTDMIPTAIQLPTVGSSQQFHWGFVIALVAAAFAFVLLYRTPLGYEIRMVGHNPNFAGFGGVAVPRVILGAMVIGGALAGIGGAIQVLGFAHQYTTTFTNPQWGFTGVTVALLARLEPIGVVVAAVLYALLEEGAQLMANNTNVDQNIITVVQGLIILFVTARVALDWRKTLKLRTRAGGI